MSNFFIHRPIFAWVVAILITFAGLVTLPSAPVEQYPDVAPPTIQIRTQYPGATAEEVARSVTGVIEDELSGADNLLYFSSDSNSKGGASIEVTFEPGTDEDLAQIDVQNRVQSVTSSLPQSVLDQGIRYSKGSSNFLMIVGLTSKDGSHSAADLGDYARRNIQNTISRIEGVGNFQLFAGERAMRIWVKPEQLSKYDLSITEVNQALREQNIQIPAGRLGSPPAPDDQMTATIVSTNGELETVEDFENVVLRADTDGSTVYLKDVAKLEIGQNNYSFNSKLNGKPVTVFGVNLSIGANALKTSEKVIEAMEDLSQYFPEGVVYDIPYNTAPYVAKSITQVGQTLVEAILLVFVVMFLFLQNFRYTIIPAIVVPVAMLGTLAVLVPMGYSVNTLTMFAMVLAIGILVDDAIVVVENVERIMQEERLSPLEATLKGMPQISGAIVGITLVLVTVFLPLVFMSGSSGVIYRQFAMAMMVSISFSAFLALTFTPALCATFLKPITSGASEKKGFFGWFNRKFNKLTHGYVNLTAGMLKRSGRVMIIYLCIGIGLGYMYLRLPSSFLPSEDQGYALANIELPSDASASRSDKVINEIEDYFLDQPETKNIVTIRGFSFNGEGLNAGISFVMFKDFAERKGEEQSAQAIAGRATGQLLFGLPDSTVFALVPPSIPSLGNATGFNLQLEDRGGIGVDALNAAAQELVAAASQSKVLQDVRISGLGPAPAMNVKIDRAKAKNLGVNISDVGQTISTAIGGAYVNKFSNFGRMQQVWVQMDHDSRMTPDDLLDLEVHNLGGDLVKLSAFVDINWDLQATLVKRYNTYYSVAIDGQAAPGYANGDAMDEMANLIENNLSADVGYEWTGLSLQEIQAGNQAPIMMALSIFVIFLVLAALYESWAIPFSALLVIPLGMLGTIGLTFMKGMSNDIYFQIGMVTVIGLSAKNAILIVEFAKDAVANGKDLIEATLEASRLRFRPILMTSFAFIMGVSPLLLASAEGAASQQAVGTGVVGGMLSATPLSVLFVPVFFVVVLRIFKTKPKLLGAQAEHQQREIEKRQYKDEIYNEVADISALDHPDETNSNKDT